MTIEKVKIEEIKRNPNNPRIIKDDKFKKLVQSIKDFPEMLEIRPIVVDENMIVLGGNMRLKACKEANLKEIPIIKASELTDEQKSEFIIKDNLGYGEWDFNLLNNSWDKELLVEWDLMLPQSLEEVDYSILDEDDEIDNKLDEMQSDSKKAIQIEFELTDYQTAYDLVKECRKKDIYIGQIIIESLKKCLEIE